MKYLLLLLAWLFAWISTNVLLHTVCANDSFVAQGAVCLVLSVGFGGAACFVIERFHLD